MTVLFPLKVQMRSRTSLFENRKKDGSGRVAVFIERQNGIGKKFPASLPVLELVVWCERHDDSN